MRLSVELLRDVSGRGKSESLHFAQGRFANWTSFWLKLSGDGRLPVLHFGMTGMIQVSSYLIMESARCG